ncbi:tetratricopeptide repeat protein [Variovorax ginsengisoli]|uniref:Tetratricopeptide repeat protein n=1 Tax=Variovorax ginsengisoli TaxID=363844 RepID=A0ABT8SIS8_9BURK|nr:tetratricopeptide repeat protein [Variovorax ginsengisoli]MDN8618897.1 tetratricopeptide repeat protein [Variovorax ginsengisoli]MDO1538067.1 tetratricopeptide repeat protein [Variovorax ginsengisoli]
MNMNEQDMLCEWRPSAPISADEEALLLEIAGSALSDGLHTDTHDGAQYLKSKGMGLRPVTRTSRPIGLLTFGKRSLADGEYRKALSAFALALRLRLVDHQDDSEPVLEALHEVAVALVQLDELELASRLFRQVIAIRERELGVTHLYTIQSTNALVATLVQLGQAPKAVDLAMELLRVCQAERGFNDLETLGVWHNCGTAMAASGHLDKACSTLEEALQIAKDHWGPDHESALNLEYSLGEALYQRGEFTRAIELESHVHRVRERTLGAEHPLTLKTAGNLIHSLLKANRGSETIGLSSDHRRRVESLHGIESFKTLRARKLEDASNARSTGNLDSSTAIYEQLRRLHGDVHPETLIASLDVADEKAAAGEWDAGRILFETAFNTLELRYGLDHAFTLIAACRLLTAASTQRDFECTRLLSLRLLASLGRMTQIKREIFTTAKECVESWVDEVIQNDLRGEGGHAPDRFEEVRPLLLEASRYLQELRELGSSESVQDSNEDFSRFHHWWLHLSLRYAPDEAIVALSPLHGMQTWTVVGDEISKLASEAPSASTGLPSLRRALADLRTEIGLVQARATVEEGPSASPRIVLAKSEQQHATRVEVNRLLAQERELLARYREAREEARELDPAMAAFALPYSELTVSKIAAQLESGSGLAVLHTTGDTRIAIIITNGGLDVQQIPDLPSTQEKMPALGHTGEVSRNSGMRDLLSKTKSASDEEIATREVRTWTEDLDLHLAESFWTLLHIAHPEIWRWQIVSGPGTHGLAVTTAPQWGQASFYCGIPAYLRLRSLPKRKLAPAKVDVIVEPNWSRAPIPFVEAEAKLNARLRLGAIVTRTDAQSWLTRRENRYADSWLIACHGIVDGEAQSLHGSLLIDAGRETRFDALAVSALAKSSDVSEVFLSACVGGLVGSTHTGDALGIVAALQVQGVRAVIACLAPVSDFYMPLLSSAYVLARRTDAPPTALHQAKVQLLSGDWPRRMVTAVQDIYREQIVEVLHRIALLGALGADQSSALVALVDTLRDWVLPDDFRKTWFDASIVATIQARSFAASEWCTVEASRKSLANRVVGGLVDARAGLPPPSRRAIEQICACTVCYG